VIPSRLQASLSSLPLLDFYSEEIHAFMLLLERVYLKLVIHLTNSYASIVPREITTDETKQ